MNLFSKRRPDAEAAGPSGRGPVTGLDLGALDSLNRPFAQDPFYRLRPPFSQEAAQLSLELANMTYTLELEPWTEAGWTDFSILIDDSLHAGVAHPESGEKLRSFVSSLRLKWARSDLRERNPVSQLFSALRQREKSDTVKAVCMMHPLEDGRWLLAIGFMGTGSRFYDWFSNLRFTTEEGFHRGFYQLCNSFEENAEEIQFPAVAEALGLEKLTLGQVLMEMRSLSSRFRLWMAGHSQGGAVMQVFTHRLMHDWGVLAQNIVGYGFASPTVATGRLVYDPAAYPLCHILNSDDLVPRMGALLHLGLCLEYPSDDLLRSAAYDPLDEEADREAIDMLAPYRAQMQDTPSVLLQLTALLQCLAEEKGEEGLADLMSRAWSLPFIDRLLMHAGDRAMDLVNRAQDAMQAGYAAMTGRLMTPDQLAALREEWRPVVGALSVRRLLAAMAVYAVPPHRIVFRTENVAEGAYAWIVRLGTERLRPFLWVKVSGGLPVRRYADWLPSAWPVLSLQPSRRQTRRAAAPAHGKMRISYHARRGAG